MTTAIPLPEYRQAVREDVCKVCCRFVPSKSGSDSRCALELSEACPIFAKLPAIVETVSAITSSAMDPYVAELRNRVCAHCEHQDKNGVCDVRDAGGPAHPWCILDTYYHLVVGAIERARQSHQERS